MFSHRQISHFDAHDHLGYDAERWRWRGLVGARDASRQAALQRLRLLGVLAEGDRR